MLHTLSELQEKEKKSKNKKASNNAPKKSFPEDKGKGNKAYEDYNQRGIEDNNAKFDKTKNKIKLVVYKNGFILNNGSFRDRSFPENNKFMLEVEKGNIPQEIVDKGITDLGILLINRKNEIYYPPIDISPITQITQITQINPINPITVNPINQYNQINQFNPNQQIYNNINSYPYQYQSSYPYQYLDEFFEFDVIDNPYGYTVDNRPRSNTLNRSLPPQTPVETRKVRNNKFKPKAEKKESKRDERSAPKRESKKRIRTFESFKKLEFLKEEEEKKKKLIEREKLKKNYNLDEIEEEKEKEKEKEKKEKEKSEEKKFVAFRGEGKTIGNINVEGLNIHKEVKNKIDAGKPVCTVSVRLFNGEIVKGNFNYTQKLRDLYYFIKKTSGSTDFYLLDGFPPQPLKDYNKTIGELKLENTILTQKIN